MARQRPVAGQRLRSRLGSAADRPAPAAGAATTPAALGTTVLDRAGDPVRPEPPAPSRRRLPGGDPGLLLAAALVLALLVTSGLVALRARAQDLTEQARTQALAAAEAHAVDLLSYDYRHLDRDFARARQDLTGRFAADYRTTTAKVVRPTAEQVKAVVKADVVASSVVRAAQHRVVVLLFVNQTTTSTRLDAPKVDLDRVRLTLDQVDGKWLVSQVSAL